MWDTAMNAFAMLTDLVPLIVVVMPAPEGGCGAMPLGTQMMMLAAALLNTMMRILDTMCSLVPLALGVVVAVIVAAFKLLTADPHVKALLVNIFGGIMKCDVIAAGIVDAAKVVRLAVQDAVSIAGLLITTEVVIADKPEPPAAAAPAPPEWRTTGPSRCADAGAGPRHRAAARAVGCSAAVPAGLR